MQISLSVSFFINRLVYFLWGCSIFMASTAAQASLLHPYTFDTLILVTVAAEKVNVYQVYVFEIHFLPASNSH